MDEADDQRRGATAKELEHELDELERLVSGVAHDLNNLATTIRTSVHTLRHLPGDAPAATWDESLTRIDRAATQAVHMMGALASFGRHEPQITSAALTSAVDDAARFLRRALRVEIEVAADRGAPRADAHRRIHLDFARLVRALIQLCTRASQAGARIVLAAAGDREISVELVPAAPDGPSILPSERDVAHARRLLEEIEGSLPLCSADQRGGWTGSLRLSSAPPASISTPRSKGRGTAERRGRALIAEDHPQVRDALIAALSRCGFSVEAVGDGDALVDRGIAEAGNHDVFLIDFELPGRDGATALEALREAGIRTPALMISGNSDFGPRVERIENADFLQKPFGLADIREWATSQLPTDPTHAGASRG